jgi:octaprenyl-diphosphate synthase
MQVIRKKTAVLFAAAAEGAALLAGATESTARALRTFGLNLGIAFQVIDDVLDYSGDPSLMGKNVGDDLAEGKATLPLIHALANAPVTEAQSIREAILGRDQGAIATVLETVQRHGALEYAHSVATRYRDLAIEALGCVPDSEFRSNLLLIGNLAVQRQT